MPAEWQPHERCVMAWPTVERAVFWDGLVDQARGAWADVANAIVQFEPVTMIANAPDLGRCVELCAPEVEVIAIPIDDCWTRDSGPIVMTSLNGQRVGAHFGFNAWGSKFPTYANDAAMPVALCEHLGLARKQAPFILEGGSVAVDGNGLLVTTERCLLNPNRNPHLSKAEIESLLCDWLGVSTVVWLSDGIVEDDGTDGHIDNVVAFVGPGECVLQGCDDPTNPNHAQASDNRQRLEAAGIVVHELPVLPYATVNGQDWPVPYLNFYVANGGIVVPVNDHAADSDTLAMIETLLVGRRAVGVPGAILAAGGGGVHCITQQIPVVLPG